MDAALPQQRDDGTVFPVWNVSLAISQMLQPDGSQPISIALRCVPARVSDSGVETADERSVSICRGRAEDITDPQEQEAFRVVQEAVIAFLRAKGL